MNVLSDIWFWAFITMLGLQCATIIVSGHRLGRNLVFVAVALTAVTVGRFVIVLPFCPQPRFDFSIWNWIIGGTALLIADVIGMPTLSVKWWRSPDSKMHLRTSWPYNVVRHPMYLSELLWPIGWSICWGSIYGLALTPAWCLGGLIHILFEEQQLEENLGSLYRDYKQQVKSSIIPWLPF